MMRFFEKFVIFLAIFFCNLESYSLNGSEVDIKFIKMERNDTAVFEVNLPSDWKMLKAPHISSKDETFQCDGDFKQIDSSKYEIYFKTKKADVFRFELFLCNDICTFVIKEIFFDPNSSDFAYLLLMIFFGFIGGLLLNVMPCVLPVLLLKLKQLNSKLTIIHSIIGNYFGFFLLAIILAGLKISGESIGWGMHFQNIYFLKFATIFFFILTLISFEKIHFYFNVNLDGLKNNFPLKNIFSSAIVTFVAIPCTAPILGTAAAFAIQESVLNLFIIFFAIATGFSFPYFFALFFKFPFQNFFKNSIFNKAINCGVLLTFLWLFWILFNSVNFSEIIIFLIFFALFFVFFQKNYKKIAFFVLICAIFVSFPKKNNFEFDQLKKVSELVKADNIVILNVTAKWCLSCKYNEIKFRSNQVRNKMKDNNVKFIEVDITQKNDKVWNFIKGHSRVGIPFTIVYGSKKKSGIILSEIPSISEIVKTIDLVK